jgi:hypothetical protein
VNYGRQMKAFEALLVKNPWRLSRSAQVLWYRLVNLADKEGGVWEVAIEGASLARLMAASQKTFLAARNELEDQGLIELEKGTRHCLSRYKLKKLYGEAGFGYMGYAPVGNTLQGMG